MGCEVNGPGEAHDSQLGVTFGKGGGMIFTDGRPMRKVSGANIVEMNTVRKHLSAIKGGRLAVAAQPARVLSWLISDVPNDDPGVIGSGPAGLAVAAELNRHGHTVTVYERDEGPGGLLRFGVPDAKLEKWIIDRRLELRDR